MNPTLEKYQAHYDDGEFPFVLAENIDVKYAIFPVKTDEGWVWFDRYYVRIFNTAIGDVSKRKVRRISSHLWDRMERKI